MQAATELTLTPRATRWRNRSKAIVRFVAVALIAMMLWELYKVVGKSLDGMVPGTDLRLRPQPDDITMPHVWDIFISLFQPARRGGVLLAVALGEAALFTLREAAAGFVIGALIGFGLGVTFVRSRLAERSFIPFVVASQTVPILAIAPMVVVWGQRLGLPQWLRVAIIAAYLTFFPVTINTLRGLRSPAATATELMRSYAASPREILWKLQVPAALPYIFTALKVSATASVIGAIVGELPSGARDGLGRQLLELSQQFTANPSKLYAAVLFSALAGILFVSLVTLAERWWMARAAIPEAR